MSPEHAKLAKHKAEHEAIVSFLEWLNSRSGFEVCDFKDDNWYPIVDRQRAALIAEYFGVDVAKFNDEKEAMLAEHRKMTER